MEPITPEHETGGNLREGVWATFVLFCRCTTVRGFGKLWQGPMLLRFIWATFVVSMMCVLITSVVLLILDFFAYDVGVHTRLLLDDPSPFPALTVCHHYPFSLAARKLWQEKQVLSPGQFNRYMRNITWTNLLNNDLQAAEATSFYDSLSVYYQNLRPDEAKLLGHDHRVFLNCMRISSQTTFFEDDCRLLKGYKVRQFSHHQYLNCHTFEPTNWQESMDTSFLSLIVSMGPKESSDPDEQAFLPDIFEQAKGLRVVVHEPGTYPDLERFGLHAEPGKLNEIGYEPVRWTKMNTPTKPCFHQAGLYNDLDEVYNYTHEQCLLLHQQKEIIESCGCYYVMNPRPSFPSDEKPYCGRMWPKLDIEEFVKRLECLKHKLDISVKRKYDGSTCLPRCEYYTYDSAISITKWRAQLWQLYWLRVQNQAIRLVQDHISKNPGKDIKDSLGYRMWKRYLGKENLRDIPKEASLSDAERPPDVIKRVNLDIDDDLSTNDDGFAYIVLKRKSQNTIDNTEKLVLTLNVLVSRIGGLCSVTIGITAACVVEIIEFVYYANRHKKSKHQRRRDGMEAVDHESEKHLEKTC
ncbi:unnamed protein product [Mesocestoides corti]|uniref:Amiloride-sensitive sodium channel n=1 Tax=Mesocestoides corti TaxID=53468 RepID=A0A0R3U2C4_MESCO|nr:unnamed protein product [Mesocestoides corti]